MSPDSAFELCVHGIEALLVLSIVCVVAYTRRRAKK